QFNVIAVHWAAAWLACHSLLLCASWSCWLCHVACAAQSLIHSPPQRWHRDSHSGTTVGCFAAEMAPQRTITALSSAPSAPPGRSPDHPQAAKRTLPTP